MPFSSGLGKEETAKWFVEHCHSIGRVLDVGAGSGTYAKLIKQQKNICNDAEWVAVEAWTAYVKKFELAKIYNQVINEDIRQINWDQLGMFDVAVAGDILEHMTKDDAVIVVNNILHHAKTLIISLPVCFYPQDEVEGNPYEVHVKSDWSHQEVLDTWGSKVKNFYIGSRDRKNNDPLEIGVYWLAGTI